MGFFKWKKPAVCFFKAEITRANLIEKENNLGKDGLPQL